MHQLWMGCRCCLPLARLPVPLIVSILQKMTPISFPRLRKTCKGMNRIAEDNRKQIGIVLHRIEIDPKVPVFSIQDSQRIHLCIINGTLRYSSADQIIFKIRLRKAESVKKRKVWLPPSQEGWIEMTLPEASWRLSGFTFDKVITGQKFVTGHHAVNRMDPSVLSQYMNFIRQQCWRTSTACAYYTPMEIIKVIRPRCLLLLDNNCLADIPISVSTLVTWPFNDGALLDFSHIPSHIDTLIIDEPVSITEGHLPQLISNVAMLFYEDRLHLSYIQLKRLHASPYCLKMDHYYDTDAPAALLSRNLKQTPYSASEIRGYVNQIKTYKLHSKEDSLKWICTGSVVMTSRRGRKGLLGVRMERFPEEGLVRLSLYYVKDWDDFLGATMEYPEREGDGIIREPFLGDDLIDTNG